jgi:hypothetical protein
LDFLPDLAERPSTANQDLSFLRLPFKQWCFGCIRRRLRLWRSECFWRVDHNCISAKRLVDRSLGNRLINGSSCTNKLNWLFVILPPTRPMAGLLCSHQRITPLWLNWSDLNLDCSWKRYTSDCTTQLVPYSAFKPFTIIWSTNYR